MHFHRKPRNARTHKPHITPHTFSPSTGTDSLARCTQPHTTTPSRAAQQPQINEALTYADARL
jgi:hypothetical protein